jgi:hypothetical protein
MRELGPLLVSPRNRERSLLFAFAMSGHVHCRVSSVSSLPRRSRGRCRGTRQRGLFRTVRCDSRCCLGTRLNGDCDILDLLREAAGEGALDGGEEHCREHALGPERDLDRHVASRTIRDECSYNITSYL